MASLQKDRQTRFLRTMQERLHIVEETRGMSLAKTARLHNVSRATIASWRKNERAFRQLPNRFRRRPPNVKSDNAEITTSASASSAVVQVSLNSTRPTRIPGDLNFMIAGYLGHTGTPADIVSRKLLPSLITGLRDDPVCCETVGFPRVEAILNAIQKCQIDFGVVPNTSILSLSPTTSIHILASRRLKIVGELTYRSKFCICAFPGTNLRDCDCIMSDMDTLARHASTISTLEQRRGSTIATLISNDSAIACHSIMQQNARNVAVIATMEAASTAGLTVLVDGICSDYGFDVGFLVISPNSQHQLSSRSLRALNDNSCFLKSTLLASLHSHPQWFHRVSSAFAEANLEIVDLTTSVAPKSNEYVYT